MIRYKNHLKKMEELLCFSISVVGTPMQPVIQNEDIIMFILEFLQGKCLL
jgi:hypothetical protein